MAIAVGKDVERLINQLANDEIPPGHLFQMYYGGWWSWEEDAESRKRDCASRLARSTNDNDKASWQEKIDICSLLLQALTENGNNLEQCLNSYMGIFPETNGDFPFNKTFLVAEAAARKRIAKTNCVLLDRRIIDGRNQDLLRQLIARQKTAAPKNKSWIRNVTLSAPLVTGIGREHPTENGFAFLDPYGLPYYSGSGVKGGLRRAAEELALFEEDHGGWTLPAVWWLFGFDGDAGYFGGEGEWKEAAEEHAKSIDGNTDNTLVLATWEYFRLSLGIKDFKKNFGETPSCLDIVSRLIGDRRLRRSVHMRGALDVWDVFPEPSGGKIRIDVLNPHDKEYYENGTPPGTFHEPKPHYFLTVPVDSKLQFIAVRNDRLAVPGRIADSWNVLLDKALGYVGNRTGIGAKTSVGYGRFTVDPVEGGAGAGQEEWSDALLVRKANTGELVASKNSRNATKLLQDLAGQVPDPIMKKLMNGKNVIAKKVTVSRVGNAWNIVSLEF